LENHSIPLVLRAKMKFGKQMHLLFSNKAAMAFLLIEKLASKKQHAGVT